MTNDDLVEKYKHLNRGKRRKLVFQLTGRGFASEINNMLSAMLYCLVHDIEFILYSKPWCASHEKGWQDYFLPFCEEYTDKLFYRNSAFELGHDEKKRDSLQKSLFKNHYNAHDLWFKIIDDNFLSKEFIIPELGIEGDIFQAKRVLLKIICRYNLETESRVHAKDEMLSSIKPFISLHIRQGDKAPEAEVLPGRRYIEQIKKAPPHLKNVFVASDDYRVIEDCMKHCPDRFRIVTFCKPTTTGYDQDAFSQEKVIVKKQQMLDLFLDLHFLVQSRFFIGTYSSNIARLVALFKGRNKCQSLDIPEWHPR